VIFIDGARARIDGDPSRDLGLDLDDSRVHIRFAEPYPNAALLLATLASAGPERLAPAGPPVGSGAFRIPSFPVSRLLPEIHHRQGRSFAELLEVLKIQTPFGLRTELRRRRGVVIFGIPGQTGPEAARTRRLDPRGFPASELCFLRAGRQSDLPIDVLHSIGAALPRERLAEREWAGETLPAPSVRAGAESVLSVERRLSTARSATLSYLEEEGPGRRLIERLQLDLLRLGVSARLDPLDLAAFESRRKSRDFDLLVEPVTLEGSEAEVSVHEFHRILALAAHFGVSSRVLAPGDLSRFATSDGATRAQHLVQAERELLKSARIVPLVRRDLEIRVTPDLEGVHMRSFGFPELGGALVTPPEQGP
jgi:MarR-like DNA-binding transcriptional regulator SgrR of sgrS sRNA